MTFDYESKAEAEAMFDARCNLEITNESGWAALSSDNNLINLVFADRSRAIELASPSGLRLSDGRSVRFIVPLTLKKKWFDMIASGEKLEEYREIKPY